MDWKISDIDEIFSIDLAERDGLITVSSINIDGENTELPEVIISRLDDRSRVSVHINGNLEFAHVAKSEINGGYTSMGIFSQFLSWKGEPNHRIRRRGDSRHQCLGPFWM